MVTICRKFRFDHHKGKQPSMVNAHLPLKCSYSLANYGTFKTLRHVKCYCHIVTISKTSSVRTFQIHISKRIKLWMYKEWHVI